MSVRPPSNVPDDAEIKALQEVHTYTKTEEVRAYNAYLRAIGDLHAPKEEEDPPLPPLSELAQAIYLDMMLGMNSDTQKEMMDAWNKYQQKDKIG